MGMSSPRSFVRFALVAIVLLLVGLPPSAASAKGRADCERKVKKGETLSHIARKVGVTEKHLVAANPALKKNPNRLRVGQTLDICRARRIEQTKPQKCDGGGRIVTHTVGKGETLGAIAARYSVNKSALVKHNKRLKARKSSMIRAGEKLRICTNLRRYTNRSWFTDGVQLPEGEGYNIRRPANAWGTSATIDGIVDALARYRETEPDAPLVQVGDVSRHNGGPLREHVSHQEGRDVDIGYVFEEWDDGTKTMDLARTWALVKSFAEHEDVAVIFMDYAVQKRIYEHAKDSGVDQAELDRLFQYPREGDDEAVFYHWPGHGRHFHVRFGKVPADPEEDDEADTEVAEGETEDDAETAVVDPRS
jgi:LysM repeat protein